MDSFSDAVDSYTLRGRGIRLSEYHGERLSILGCHVPIVTL